jgi:hypothetical protein
VWLGAALAAPALTGCADAVPPAVARAARREQALRAAAAADSTALLARYDATAAAHPALAGRLAPLRAQVALHVQAFTPSGPSGGQASGAPSAPPPRPASSHGPAVPAAQAAALDALASAETALADSRTSTALHAPADLARLLASVAACGAAHAVLLGGGAS